MQITVRKLFASGGRTRDRPQGRETLAWTVQYPDRQGGLFTPRLDGAVRIRKVLVQLPDRREVIASGVQGNTPAAMRHRGPAFSAGAKHSPPLLSPA